MKSAYLIIPADAKVGQINGSYFLAWGVLIASIPLFSVSLVAGAIAIGASIVIAIASQ